MKPCRVCKTAKPLADFHKAKGGRDGHRNTCKPCSSAWAAENYRNNTLRIRATNARWMNANRERARQQFRIRKLAKYGLTPASYDTLILAQGGCCAICGKKSVEKFNIDHDHETNEVRGLLCGPCNRGIGLLGDSVDTLKRAVEYLELKLGNV